MNKVVPKSIAILAICTTALLVAWWAPVDLPTNSDFAAIYYANLAMVHGVGVYDTPAVERLAITVSGIPDSKFVLARFPYPPWYNAATFYLGLLPIRSAATLWFELNLIMLSLAVWLLTDGWPSPRRMVALPLAVLFVPVLGSAAVGQYDFPILLGASLLTRSLPAGRPIATGVGVALLTFKPHMGLLPLAATILWLLAAAPAQFRRQSMQWIVAAGVILAIAGLIVDPRWPVNYLAMLSGFQTQRVVMFCSDCANLPIYLSRLFSDGTLSSAAFGALGILGLLVALFARRGKALGQSPDLLICAAILVTLLSSPYSYNYDFMMLLIPFATLAAGSRLDTAVVFFCYASTSIVLAFAGRAGNPALAAVTAAMTVVLLARLASRAAGSCVDACAQ